ncbi:MAG TPA: hypothetical protein VFL38_06370, partial [Humibacillus xanthopallidus]|nr:hypothetical protein [Humibacillus xanthopallidus]
MIDLPTQRDAVAGPSGAPASAARTPSPYAVPAADLDSPASGPAEKPAAGPVESHAAGPTPRSRARRRRAWLAVARLAIVAALLAVWQVGVNAKVVDPFFWGEPQGVWATMYGWFTEGTSQGSLADQIIITLEEAVLGFLIGAVLGVVLGIALGR